MQSETASAEPQLEKTSVANTRGYISFDRAADLYDRTRLLPPEPAALAARTLQQAGRLMPGDTLIDAGVGTGRFALPLSALGIHVVGLDISSRMMARLQNKVNASGVRETAKGLRLVRADLRSMPVYSGSAKALLIVHVLHLIEDWRAVLDEAKRVVQPSGTVLLAWETSGVPTRDQFYKAARHHGAITEQIGARDSAAIREWLIATNAIVHTVDTSSLRWSSSFAVSETLEMLRMRAWSHLWQMDDAAHGVALQETEAWARREYGDLETLEHSESNLVIWQVSW